MTAGTGERRCSVDGCDRKYSSKGYCNLHYQRVLKHGSPLVESWRKVTAWGAPTAFIDDHLRHSGEDCLKWPFADDGHGYGHLIYNGKRVKAHRIMCTLAHGPPPFHDAEVAHSCGKGKDGCVNPGHLRWATAKENNWDKVEHQTDNRGERCGTHKLVRGEVLEIVDKLEAGKTHQSIADEYGVHRCSITDIAKGKNWSWLTGRVFAGNPLPPAANDNSENMRVAG